jgi:3-mercaptopyruvate sulfurtransferase SseA
MSEKIMKKSRGLIAALLGTVMIAALTIWGCGTSSYDNPTDSVVTTKTATALITAADLKTWVDAGLVNKAGGYDRVVILEASSVPNYSTAHISGAQYVDLANDLTQTRVEGPMLTGQLVVDGAKMDALIQKYGIDANTTIVFTSSEAEVGYPWNLTRGYTTFRYWGFPKNRLKVLDGGNKAWKAAGYELTASIPNITRSSYCVTANNVSRIRTDLRASLTDMITAVTAGTATNDFIDGRATDPVVPGPTSDLIDTTTPTKYVVFEGMIKGGHAYSYANLIDATTKQFKSIADIKTGLNIPATATSVYTLCRAGNIASALFFAIDGYAYYNEVESGAMKAVWYDGSWGQWGLLASSDKAGTTTTNAGGKLAVGSVWDTTALTNSLTYNIDAVPVRPVVVYNTRLSSPAPPLAAGNQLEEADAAYRSPITTTSGGAASTGGGGC